MNKFRFLISCMVLLLVFGNLSIGYGETRKVRSFNTIRFDHSVARHRIPVVVGVSLNLEGDQLVTVGDDHKARIWDLKTGNLRNELSDQADWVRTVKFRPDGKAFVTGGMDQNMYCYDAQNYQRLFQFQSSRYAVRSVTFSPDSERMAMVGFNNTVCIYETTYGRLLRRWQTTCTDQRCVAFSPDSRYLASAGRDGIVRIFDTTTGAVVKDFHQHIRRVNSLAFSPDGKFLATGGEDQKVCIWSMESKELQRIYEYPSGKVTAITFCGNDLVAAGSANNTIYVWNIHKEAETPVYNMDEHTGTVAELLWDAAKNVLISCSFDTTVRFWKWDTTEVAALPDENLQ